MFKIQEWSDFFGVTGVGRRETDYNLGADIWKLPKPPHTFKDFKIQYNQKAFAPYGCTLYGPMGAVSDLTGRTWSVEDQKSIYEQSIALGLDPKKGWKIARGVDLVRENYFRIYNQELLTFAIDLDSQKAIDAIDQGYSLVIGIRSSKELNIDVKKDDTIDVLTPPLQYSGHCLRANDEDPIYDLIVDNYVGVKDNDYKIRKADLKKAVQTGLLYKTAYVFVIKKDFEELNAADNFWTNVPLYATSAVEKAIKKGLITLKSDLNEIVGTKSLEDSLIKLGIFTKAVGNVTLVRWLVALEKLKQI